VLTQRAKTQVGHSGTIIAKGWLVSKLRVVAVIDDDDSFRIALGESLRALGYDAREFATAEEFIARDAYRQCDCVITDVRMPGMSGLELARLLASRAASLPIILVTAVAEPNLACASANADTLFVLKKPFPTDALTDCLQRALKG
jgi:FixJ family two-component response regulator